ncbi:MAG: hypothetical protein ABII74_02215 [Elusimicrobiota bacterium]
MRREYGDYLSDILESMNKMEKFIKGLDYNNFAGDEKNYFCRYQGLGNYW